MECEVFHEILGVSKYVRVAFELERVLRLVTGVQKPIDFVFKPTIAGSIEGNSILFHRVTISKSAGTLR